MLPSLTPTTSMAITDAQRTAIQAVFKDLYACTSGPGGRGRELYKMFDLLPDRTTWKEYYAVIPEPRCLSGVKVRFFNLFEVHPAQTVGPTTDALREGELQGSTGIVFRHQSRFLKCASSSPLAS